ncbi:hypothetical protein SERLADRAFT_409558 [Serpula lacrymans var. lacrymans S7.9]|uniref:CxC1-like cysteine cluster associated with KDZ transposases domain-containing protein n=1 Tax=Serpula lacrymans var. lacrymans (strain S7.9) TaxID=578457 RepID=F8P1V0_SERL9|nr:uncharacterized protein SERLADRAFT_409558 [Serpula lacrymans var. lacrymans S7.9]EGO23128.1 hypothetical protein SERLADRAFT_409558 [Serpula lacrymans var. lacrymans S7.9]
MNHVTLASGAGGDDNFSLRTYEGFSMDWVDDKAFCPDILHEGGEYGDSIHCAFESLQGTLSGKHKAYNCGKQHQWQRLQSMYKHWDKIIPSLAHAFLEWKHRGSSATGYRCVDVCDTFPDQHSLQDIVQLPHENANISLPRHGLLGCSPVKPSVEIDLKVLELYQRLQRRHAQNSEQVMAKTLCDLHNDVSLQVNKALAIDTPNYRLQGEKALVPSILAAMDGNNSVKQAMAAGTADSHIFNSNYLLSRTEVNQYQNEVKRSLQKKLELPELSKDNIERDLDVPWVKDNTPGDAADGEDIPSACGIQWKNTAPENEKVLLAVYDISGMFVGACRHGIIIKACEMVQSGELTKYPLAIIDHILDNYGSDVGIGYDIGCAHEATIVVNTFHGYGHNCLCQLCKHPLYLTGYGLEDLETLERVFSASNSVARGKFLYNNYQQALTITKDYVPHVSAMTSELGIHEDSIKDWIKAEHDLLENLKDEPEEWVLASAYVCALIQRNKAEGVSIGRESNYTQLSKDTQCIEIAWQTAIQELIVAIRAVGDIEEKMANMAGTGYKLQVAIGRAIKTRRKAIQTALAKYNSLAAQMIPPTPILQWSNIINYGFASNPILAAEIEEIQKRQLRVDSVHIARLNAIKALPGFSGIQGLGVQLCNSSCSSGPDILSDSNVIDSAKRQHIEDDI